MDQKKAPDWFGSVGRFWGGSRNAFEVEKELHFYEDSMEGVALARRYMRIYRNYRISKLKAAGRKNGKKYNIKRQNSGFVCWSGRKAFDELMTWQQKQCEVPF
jgi:hypothetical protein